MGKRLRSALTRSYCWVSSFSCARSFFRALSHWSRGTIGGCGTSLVVISVLLYIRSSDQIFQAIRDVARVAEIADNSDFIGRPPQQNKVFRPRANLVGIEHQDGGASFHQPRHQMPVVDLRIIAEISG